MLGSDNPSRRIASAALFAVIYSITRLIPIAPYVGISSYLTFGETLSPLAGMLLGPVAGGGSVVIGTFLDFFLGRPVVFDGLDFLPGLASAVTAGLFFSGRRKVGFAIPIALMVIYTLDPLSAGLVSVGPLYIPFLWMHILSVLAMVGVWLMTTRGKLQTSSWVYVAATIFLATMTAHVMGSIVYENILVRVNGSLSATAIKSVWSGLIYVYPPERIFFTIAGTIIALPVLRSLARRPPR